MKGRMELKKAGGKKGRKEGRASDRRRCGLTVTCIQYMKHVLLIIINKTGKPM